MNRHRTQFLALISFLSLLIEPTFAETYRVTPDGDWFARLNGSGLKPGDELVLAPGFYSSTRRLELGHQGTREKPITIRGEKGAIIKRPDARQNTINMAGCQFLALRDLEITGGSAGIRIYKAGDNMARFLLFENLHIHGTAGAAITANNEGNTYERLIFRRNHIHHTGGHGEGFYLGCNNSKDGSTPGYIFNCIIEQNYIHDLKGGTVSQGDGIEIKDGSYGNIIRDNVIHDTKYPGITVYGTDGKERNVIERNVIWNTGDNGIQAAADSIIRNNIIRSSGGDGIHCRNHQSAVVGNLTITHNTILSRRSLRIYELPKYSGAIQVANNSFASTPRIPKSPSITQAGNVTGIKELFPKKSSPAVGAADKAFLTEDDFNRTNRTGSLDSGAYRFSSEGNPGWEIGPGFKQLNTRQ